jgi:hypothetical protein
MKHIDWSWDIHRLAVDRLGWQRPFPRGTSGKRLLFITEKDILCQTQVFPFWHHRADFAGRHRIELRELPLARFLAGKNPYPDADAVCFQTFFDLSPDDVAGMAERVQAAFPAATLAYVDWFAPTDLRYAEALDGHIAAYVKKQVFRDFGQYGETTLGDTNLTDYYARRFQLQDYVPTRFEVPPGFKDKLWLSPHFAFSPHMLPYFRREFPAGPRDIDLHARIAVKGTEWYSRMRQEAQDKVRSLEGRLTVASRGHVPREEYFRELFRAKTCFSPFGYGEVCWRDFEAIFTGALLLKPDMSHLDCSPEVFLPYETYVPVAWDLSDFEDKLDHYLGHEDERQAIARQAFELLRDYFREQRFMADVVPLLQRLKLIEAGP